MQKAKPSTGAMPKTLSRPCNVRTIGPGTADVAHYSFRVPADYAGRKLTLRARLLWRKFDRAYTEFAFNNNRQGFRRFDQVPDLPITEIARSEVELAVGGPSATGAPDAGDWMRFNDYGIGLLLQDDTQGAARAFATVEQLALKRLDGCRNLARGCGARRPPGAGLRAFGGLRGVS